MCGGRSNVLRHADCRDSNIGGCFVPNSIRGFRGMIHGFRGMPSSFCWAIALGLVSAVVGRLPRTWCFAPTARLARDPEMPSSLRNRAADNCRPLLAIADALGHGEAARTALVELHSNRPDEDPGVSLLADIRKVFLARGVDRIGSKDLVEAMLELEDAVWAEWRGVNDDRPPHKLIRSELARLLQPFGIRSKTIWPIARRPGDRSCRGYTRDQFEAAWAAYCPTVATADTATQPSKIIGLPRS